MSSCNSRARSCVVCPPSVLSLAVLEYHSKTREPYDPILCVRYPGTIRPQSLKEGEENIKEKEGNSSSEGDREEGQGEGNANKKETREQKKATKARTSLWQILVDDMKKAYEGLCEHLGVGIELGILDIARSISFARRLRGEGKGDCGGGVCSLDHHQCSPIFL